MCGLVSVQLFVSDTPSTLRQTPASAACQRSSQPEIREELSGLKIIILLAHHADWDVQKIQEIEWYSVDVEETLGGCDLQQRHLRAKG